MNTENSNNFPSIIETTFTDGPPTYAELFDTLGNMPTQADEDNIPSSFTINMEENEECEPENPQNRSDLSNSLASTRSCCSLLYSNLKALVVLLNNVRSLELLFIPLIIPIIIISKALDISYNTFLSVIAILVVGVFRKFTPGTSASFYSSVISSIVAMIINAEEFSLVENAISLNLKHSPYIYFDIFVYFIFLIIKFFAAIGGKKLEQFAISTVVLTIIICLNIGYYNITKYWSILFDLPFFIFTLIPCELYEEADMSENIRYFIYLAVLYLSMHIITLSIKFTLWNSVELSKSVFGII